MAPNLFDELKVLRVECLMKDCHQWQVITDQWSLKPKATYR